MSTSVSSMPNMNKPMETAQKLKPESGGTKKKEKKEPTIAEMALGYAMGQLKSSPFSSSYKPKISQPPLTFTSNLDNYG